MNKVYPQDRTALITGGTSGLGLESARALLRSTQARWTVLIGARNATEGARVAQKLNLEAGREAVRYLPLDLGSLHAIEAFARGLVQQKLLLDALVCNAGLQFVGEARRTTDGFEATFGINHLGHFLLAHRLAPALARNARIVVVSSGTHDPAQRTGVPAPRFMAPALLARPELDTRKEFAGDDGLAVVGRRRYSTSKLCNMYFAYELDRLLRSLDAGHPMAGITVNAFDPGLMPGTGLAREYPAFQRFLWNHVLTAMQPLLRRLMGNVNSPGASGRALARLVEADDLPVRTGGYFEGAKAIRSSTDSYDVPNARLLWTESLRLVGLQGHAL